MTTTTTNTYRPTFHRDGTVTVWHVYRQAWCRTSRPSDAVLASLDARTRARVMRHCGIEECICEHTDSFCPVHNGTGCEADAVQVGQRITCGEGDDRDSGEVLEVDGDYVLVGWDSGVQTRQRRSVLGL